MIFTLLHYTNYNLIPGDFSNQTRNLVTFLVGVLLYTWLWSYLFSKKRQLNSFLNGIRYGFAYILIADCMAMGIVYKNYYQSSILNEVKEAWGDNTPRTKNGTPVGKTPVVETVEEIIVIPEKVISDDASEISYTSIESQSDVPVQEKTTSPIVEGSETSHRSEKSTAKSLKPVDETEKITKRKTEKKVNSEEKKPRKNRKSQAKIEVEKKN